MSKILVVDDDRDICSLIEFKLKKAGYEVLLRFDGATGLEAVRSERPDLLLLDWMMPGLDGLEVCSAIRSDDSFRSMPILFLTAKAQQYDLDRAFAAGADDYCIKPFSPRDLARRVETLLEASACSA